MMTTVPRPTDGASSLAPSQSHLLQKEGALICVWKTTSSTDAELTQALLSAVSSQQNPNDAFAGSAQVIDRWNAKTTLLLTGRHAHRAALYITSLPRQSSQYPWANVSEHNRDWVCPRSSCVECRPNIGAAPSCRHCGGSRPKNLRDSMQIWRDQISSVEEAAVGCNDGDIDGAPTGRSASTSNSSSSTAMTADGPAPKRARFAPAAPDSSLVDISCHPSGDEAKARLTVWGCSDSISDEQLVQSLQSMTSRVNFTGGVSIVEKSYAGKAIIILTGGNAHRAALLLSNLPNGPQLTNQNQYPWRNVSEHHREWYCPRLSCVGLEIDRPNIDESNGNNRSSARCRGCGCARPHTLLQANQLWEQDLVDDVGEAVMAQAMMDSADAHARTSEETGTLQTQSVTRTRPNILDHNLATAAAARLVTPSENSCNISAPPSKKLTGSEAEFAVWNDARLATGMDQPSASDGLLSSSKFFLNRTKDDLINLLPSLPHRRIWAFDTNPKNGAKGWIWTDCIDTFVDVYLQIDVNKRHAYEVVQQKKPCRMAFDLDMFTGDGVNGDKDDKRMAAAIIKETHQILEKNWPQDGEPQFKDEVLVAHGPTKKSYHIIVKMYGTDGKEVLLEDFNMCKVLANSVNENLGRAIMVERKPGHGGKSNPEPAPFIDLAIYTRDRPFRLVFSSKITCPDRPFSDAMKQQFSFDEERNDKTTVMDTLVVPHNADEMQTIKIKVEVDEDDPNTMIAGDTDQSSITGDGGGLASRIGGVVNSWLSWGSKAVQKESDVVSQPPPATSRLNATSEGTNLKTNSTEDEYPLLDFGKEGVARKSLGHDIAHPFKALVPWVEMLAAELPGAMRSGRAVRVAHYEYSEKEAYVHFTLNRGYASYCHCIGRPHSEQNIMISIDLFDGIAYQRCWDRSCKDSVTKGCAKHVLSCQPPTGALPTKEDLDKYDAEAGLHLN